jgi:hypothetical protein
LKEFEEKRKKRKKGREKKGRKENRKKKKVPGLPRKEKETLLGQSGGHKRPARKTRALGMTRQ